MKKWNPGAKLGLILGGIALAVISSAWYFFLSENSIFGQWRRQREALAAQEGMVNVMRHLQAEAAVIRAEKDAVMSRMSTVEQGSRLEEFLEKIRQEHAPSAVILKMQPRTETLPNLCRVDSVSVKLSRIGLNELVDLLSSVECGEGSFKIREIKFSQERKDPTRQEAEIVVFSVTDLEKEKTVAPKKEEPSERESAAPCALKEGRRLGALKKQAQTILKTTFPEMSSAPPGRELQAMKNGLAKERENLRQCRELAALTAFAALREFSRIIPPEIKLQVLELGIDQEYLRIVGRTDSFRSAQQIRNAFSNSPLFQVDRIRMGDLQSTLRDREVVAVEFKYLIPLIKDLASQEGPYRRGAYQKVKLPVDIFPVPSSG